MNAQGEGGKRRKKRLVIIPSCVVAAQEELVLLLRCEMLGRRRRGRRGWGIPALHGETGWLNLLLLPCSDICRTFICIE